MPSRRKFIIYSLSLLLIFLNINTLFAQNVPGVDYKGKIVDNRLEIDWYSNINKKQGHLVFYAVLQTKAPNEHSQFLEGLFQAKVPDLGYWEYLKFSRDGTVLEVCATNPPDDINSWMVQGQQHVSSGSYKISNSLLNFSVY